MPEQIPAYIPTPNQILTECQRIRSEWTDNQRVSRIVDDATRRGELGVVDIPLFAGTLIDEGAVFEPQWRYRKRAVRGDT